VRYQNRLGHLGVGLLGAAESLHDRRKVRAGIGEEIIGAVVGERSQEGFSGDCWPLPGRCRGHSCFVPKLPAAMDFGRYFYWGAVLTDGSEGDNGPARSRFMRALVYCPPLVGRGSLATNPLIPSPPARGLSLATSAHSRASGNPGTISGFKI